MSVFAIFTTIRNNKNNIRINRTTIDSKQKWETNTDKTQQNSKCRLCGDIDETVNHISECNKLAQKEYKTCHDWVSRNWNLTIKQLVYTQPELHLVEWDAQTSLGFGIQTDHLPNSGLYSYSRPHTLKLKKAKREKNKRILF